MSNETAATMTDSASVDFEVPAPGSAGYDEWRKTGKLPEAGESAPAEEQVQEHEPEEAETATAEEEHAEPAASAPAKPQRGKKDAAARLAELLEERKRERSQWETERQTYLRQLSERLESREKPPSQAAEPKKDEKRAKPTLGDMKDGKPRFATVAEWEDALLEWNKEMLMAEVDGRLTKSEEQRKQQEIERFVAEGFRHKAESARKKYADFDTVIKDSLGYPLPKGSPAELFVLDSEISGELTYYLAKHPEILGEFYGCTQDPVTKQWDYGDFDMKTGKFTNHVSPIQQIRILTQIERELSEETPVERPRPPARTITQAPRPPHQVSGKAPVADPLAKAVEEGDQEAFTRLENEKQLARMKARMGRR